MIINLCIELCFLFVSLFVMCMHPKQASYDILSGCKAALSQRRYRWRHDQVVRRLAGVLEPSPVNHTNFVKEGDGQRYSRPIETPRPFSLDQEWDMRVDLNRQLR